MNREQITEKHRSRLAVVYVRQSSQHQLRHHHESQRRQRNFVHRAQELGWAPERIQVVDDDQGETASRSGQRCGFEEMVALAALGKIGVILALEVSRLARGNRDWYHLLDVCSISSTLIADDEGLYDPGAYNDRLLLGLKGTMSEAELHLIKQRLVEATRAKAKRGELRRRLPAGFIWDEAGRMQKDPDEQVARAITRVFQRFEQVGTIHQTHLSLIEEAVELPVRAGRGNHVDWTRPTYGHIRSMLRNPVYAGAYVYGRRQSEESLDASLKPRKRLREVDASLWHTLLQNHHEGFLSWAQYQKNQQQIRGNYRCGDGAGAPREGESLLQGLVLCGRCGRKMRVAYGKSSPLVRYSCVKARQQTGAPVCQAFGARRLEQAVEKMLLENIAPAGMEAMLQAAQECKEHTAAQRIGWEQKIERARYDLRLAQRQYDAVDPENRLVARELERRYEKALAALETVEAETKKRLEDLEEPLSAAEELQFKRYAAELAGLWTASTTRVQDRKRIVRCLIERVVVRAPREEEKVKAEVHWRGGEISLIEVPRGKSGVHRHVSDPELVELIRTLAAEFSDGQIARILYRRGIKTAKGHTFMAYHVANVRRQYDVAKGPFVPSQGADTYTAEDAAALLGVCHSTVIRWVEAGLLQGRQITQGAPWRVIVSENDIKRLKPAVAEKEWLPLKGAAAVLGVSQQTVLQKLKSGELEGRRVQAGRRVGWRIRLPKGTYKNQSTLF